MSVSVYACECEVYSLSVWMKKCESTALSFTALAINTGRGSLEIKLHNYYRFSISFQVEEVTKLTSKAFSYVHCC